MAYNPEVLLPITDLTRACCPVAAAPTALPESPCPLPRNGGLLCMKVWLLLYLQHLCVGQILAILLAQLLTQCLQLATKQDNPFRGSLVASTEVPPRMPIICTQSPAENKSERVRRKRRTGVGTPKEHGKKDLARTAKGKLGLGGTGGPSIAKMLLVHQAHGLVVWT